MECDRISPSDSARMKSCGQGHGAGDQIKRDFTTLRFGAIYTFYGRNIMDIFIDTYNDSDDDARHEYALIMSSMI
ncbi:hypothetical protein ACFONL_10355 [Camelimonas fluminis]|uniref:Uncharacterized protein n=1 Tax=Camelimonas fluminis TaxID=1576911 RepID=A0ABV7UI21_9HYPH|nr:hypothetical protein [Camelimonas fluminis]